jgi:hypothetical protein
MFVHRFLRLFCSQRLSDLPTKMLFSLFLIAAAGSALAQNSADLFAPNFPIVAYAAGSVCLLLSPLRRVG